MWDESDSSHLFENMNHDNFRIAFKDHKGFPQGCSGLLECYRTNTIQPIIDVSPYKGNKKLVHWIIDWIDPWFVVKLITEPIMKKLKVPECIKDKLSKEEIIIIEETKYNANIQELVLLKECGYSRWDEIVMRFDSHYLENKNKLSKASPMMKAFFNDIQSL